MQLISALAAGIRGAEAGTVQIYQRGTDTRATWYENFEGGGAHSSGDDVVLGASGELVAYVNEPVDVVVIDVDGSTVRSFTDGHAATSVEVISQSFTGQDYDDAASGASEPELLSEILDLWYDNAGSIDWKVLDGAGNARTLQSIASIFGNIFVVTDVTYGAEGDGSTDDKTAIQACLTAAGAANSGAGAFVFFPPGNYRITGALSIPAGVHLYGAGAATTTITLDHATADTFDVAAIAYGYTEVSGFRITQAQANTGKLFDVADGGAVLVQKCYLGSTNFRGEVVELGTATRTRAKFRDLDAYFGGTVTTFAVTSNTLGELDLTNVTVVTAATWAGAMFGVKILGLTGCTFDVGLVTGTASIININDTGSFIRVQNCAISDETTGGGTVTAFVFGSANNSYVYEDGGLYLNGTIITPGGLLTAGIYKFGFRKQRQEAKNGGATTATVIMDTLNYGVGVITVTGTSNFLIQLGSAVTDFIPYEEYVLIIKNSAGAASGTMQFTTGTGIPVVAEFEEASFTLAANTDYATMRFRQVGGIWIQEGRAVEDVTP